MPYLIDTYAIFEWLVGNPAYVPYFDEIENTMSHTTQFVLLEFYFGLYHKLGAAEAEKKFAEITPYLDIIELDLETLKEAAKFRSDMLPKKKFSYADSVNYIAARKLKVKFLTGDEEFRGMPNVEFVK